jgi:8-oxo-dGTP pyrophosphatase MutT (NUDIX family)
MPQKYKFFIGQYWISIGQDKDDLRPKSTSENQAAINLILDKVSYAIEHMQLGKNLEFEMDSVMEFVENLEKRHRLILAGGGYVLNDNSELLLIHRRGFWDLPKGKIEVGESIADCALREVEEECNIDEVHIISDSFVTYHVYEDKRGVVLKKSVWFKMKTKSLRDPKPQTEEDITEARWQPLPVPQMVVSRMYPSIVDVIEHFA